MNKYEMLAEEMIASMDRHRHMPLEPVSSTVKGEMAVLRLLSQENRGMNAGEIAGMLHMTTSRVAAVLNALEKKNMIGRRCDPGDKRRVLVLLTETGKTTCLERRNEAKIHLTKMLSHLSEEDAEAFVRIVDQLFGVACIDSPDKEV